MKGNSPNDTLPAVTVRPCWQGNPQQRFTLFQTSIYTNKLLLTSLVQWVL